jgi:hypothetical protein
MVKKRDGALWAVHILIKLNQSKKVIKVEPKTTLISAQTLKSRIRNVGLIFKDIVG